MKLKLESILRFSISISLLGLLLYIMREKYSDIIEELKSTNLILFFIAFFLFCTNIIFITLRTKAIFTGEHISIRFVKLLKLNYIGYFFNNFMPSSVGGDIVKAYYAGVFTKERAKSYVSVFMDRLIGLFSFAFVGSIAMLLSWGTITNTAIRKSIFVFVASSLFIVFISLNVKIAKLISKILSKIKLFSLGDKLIKAYSIVHDYRNRKKILLKTFFISLIAQAVYFAVIYILIKSVSLEVSFKLVLLFMPIVSIISMLPSIGGLGVQEGAIVVLFGSILGQGRAFGISILLRAVLYLISLIGGIIYLSSSQFRHIKLKEEIVS